jgi:hypothetical protein
MPDATPSYAATAVENRTPVQGEGTPPVAVPSHHRTDQDHGCEHEQPRLKRDGDADQAVSLD